jgi:hypothetical protein
MGLLCLPILGLVNIHNILLSFLIASGPFRLFLMQKLIFCCSNKFRLALTLLVFVQLDYLDCLIRRTIKLNSFFFLMLCWHLLLPFFIVLTIINSVLRVFIFSIAIALNIFLLLLYYLRSLKCLIPILIIVSINVLKFACICDWVSISSFPFLRVSKAVIVSIIFLSELIAQTMQVLLILVYLVFLILHLLAG